jgi:hypothetical protein
MDVFLSLNMEFKKNKRNQFMSTFSGRITMDPTSGEMVVYNPNIIETTDIVVCCLSPSREYPTDAVYSVVDIQHGNFTIVSSQTGHKDVVMWIANNN